MQKIKIGISACLLGENLRYDGGNRLQAELIRELGPGVEWAPVCPEAGCGLPVPREEMMLMSSPDGLRLICKYSFQDHTAMMENWACRKIGELAGEDIRGFVFKSRSPSCGLAVKVFPEGSPRAAGIFAGLFQSAFPDLPVEEETALAGAGGRARFMRRVSALSRGS
ncbi:MAG: 2-thiouracil desulfurase family protein [Thermoleophilia bacterium]